MLLTIAQIKAIDPQTLWLEIAPADRDRATPNPQLYSNPTGIDNALLSQLCLDQFQAWLTDREIAHRDSFNASELTEIWDVVPGGAIEIDKTRIILVPTDLLDRHELRIPQEWVDLPNLLGDYYLGVQVELESGAMNVWGFTSHRSLKQRGRYSQLDRSYSLDSDLLICNLDLLWMAEELALAERTIVDELPNISLDCALALIQQLSIPSPYSPRLTLDFATWGAILNNPNLRSQLYQTRLARTAIAQSPAPSFQLIQWVRNEFTNAIASGWQHYQSVPTLAPNDTILHGRGYANERSKLVNLQVDLHQQTIILLIGIIPESSDLMRVLVRVHPAIGARHLPPQLQLSYLDTDGVSLRTVSARSNDEYIQLPAFTCQIGMEFNIQLQLNHARAIERFIV
jgi:Protein of unknown function (DUF1822)